MRRRSQDDHSWPGCNADGVASFATNGYLLVGGAISPAVVEEVSAAIEAAARATPESELTRGAMRFASNLFRTDERLAHMLTSTTLVDIARPLIGQSAWVRWDQAVWKGPGAPEFPLHQDNGYTGRSTVHLQLWLALTPMTTANGALVVVPGGHRRVLPHRWDGSYAITDVPSSDRRVIEAEPGDVIAFSSLLPHSTGPNTTDSTRLAYVAELLPLGVADPGVPRPHFVPFRDGRPEGAWVSDAGAEAPVSCPAPAI